MQALVVCAIYGPSHPLARISAPAPAADDGSRSWQLIPELATIESSNLILTQIYDARFAVLGHTRQIAPGRVVLLGRSSDLDEYMEKMRRSAGKNPLRRELVRELACMVKTGSVEIFSVPRSCECTSACHAALFESDGGWYCLDLGSSNDTEVVGDMGSRLLKGAEEPAAVRPGDCIRLGVATDATGRGWDYARGAVVMLSALAGQSDAL